MNELNVYLDQKLKVFYDSLRNNNNYYNNYKLSEKSLAFNMFL